MTTLVAKALRLKTTDTDFEAAFQKRLHWSADADAAIESVSYTHLTLPTSDLV